MALRAALRRLTLALALAAFALAALFATPTSSYACSCAPPGPPAAALAASHAVFSGTVTAVAPGAEGLLVTFDLERIWKGPEGGQITLATPGSSAACGFEFAPGEAYLVYALAQEGRLTASLCSRTAALADAAEDLSALGEGVAAPAPVAAPEAEVSAAVPWLPLAVGGVAVVAAAVAFAALRRRGRG